MPMPISLQEHADRRARLLDALTDNVGLVFAGDHAHALHDDFHAHPHFRYLTGITDEPGAALLLDPQNPVEARRDMLFLRPLNPELEQWDGARLTIASQLRESTGFKAIFRTNQLPRFLNLAARRSGRLGALHPLATYEQDVSPDLAIFNKLAQRIPNLTITDCTDEVPRLRSVKSKAEIDVIQRAVNITAQGLSRAMTMTLPGANEFDVQETIENAYRTSGSRGPSFGTIVGSGFNATVLHYRANNRVINENDLIVIDTGAAFGGYGADITRTIPASGTFTDRQREVYETVLAAMNAAIESAKPGRTLSDLDRIARAIITKAGFGDHFIHNIGHHLGIETHDAAPPDAPLAEGNVITIEPGIYLPDEKIGVRIEDDILITRTGAQNLSEEIPKTINALEQAMSQRV